MVEFKNPITSLRSRWNKRKSDELLRAMTYIVEFCAKTEEEQQEFLSKAKMQQENRLTWTNLDANGKLTLLVIVISLLSLIVSLCK